MSDTASCSVLLCSAPFSIADNQQLTHDLVQAMHDFFEPHNKELEDLLGTKLPDSWYAPPL